jgi:hypothetical protein
MTSSAIAELETPSRVACSDLLDGEFRVINFHSIGNRILRADRNKLPLKCPHWDS